ncbi:hypothetical protein GXW78_15250 [Roseomonas terrae]|uniref:Uncharacterized protein n=1 Tax=Neoroseomonas terrae TaxID=424799 RepID=A0ABS5EJ24_9PROT|nr:hypothetical protein [Neoroseomonas terrae]MBR0651028.1 hypothetical protein [Neoroseomonas terrae]
MSGQGDKPRPTLGQWLLLGAVVVGSAVAGVILPWDDPRLGAAVGLLAGGVGALACAAGAVALWRAGPAQRGRVAHCALVACLAVLALFSALLAMAALPLG